jgi:hypothetical protein
MVLMAILMVVLVVLTNLLSAGHLPQLAVVAVLEQQPTDLIQQEAAITCQVATGELDSRVQSPVQLQFMALAVAVAVMVLVLQASVALGQVMVIAHPQITELTRLLIGVAVAVEEVVGVLPVHALAQQG